MVDKNIIILTHGKFGEELIRSAEMIVGSLENVKSFSLMPTMSANEYKEKVQKYVSELKGEIFCLVDLFGGTPCNTIMYLSKQFPMSIVSGINLPMLLELYMNLETTNKEELIDLAINTLQASGKNITQLLEKSDRRK